MRRNNARLVTALLGLVVFLLPATAGAGEPGPPGSEARRQWCAAQYQACIATAKRPGYLGGPRQFCQEDQATDDCVSFCETNWGETSRCLAKPAPASD